MSKPDASSTMMSQIMFFSLIEMYKNAISSYSKNPGEEFRYKLNFMTTNAISISVIPLAVTVWEAYLNNLLGSNYFETNIISSNNELRDLIVKKADIKTKSILLPNLLYGRTFNKGSNPFQDFAKLVDIRNAIVHFNPYDYPKSAIDYLDQKKITLVPIKNATFAWPMQLYSSECIRWAINTVCSMVQEMGKFNPDLEIFMNFGFRPITLEDAKQIFSEYNLDYSFISKEYIDL